MDFDINSGQSESKKLFLHDKSLKPSLNNIQ